MRYIRKVTALILSIIFCVALVVGVGVIFAVKNVNVTYIDYSGAHADVYSLSRRNLDELKGTQLVFLDEESVREKLADDGVIAVESIEKIYPATVNIVLRERVECFVMDAGDVYNIYDDRGGLMGVSNKQYGVPMNALDGSPDIMVDADEELLPDIAKLMGYFKENFGALRSLVSSVAVHSSVDGAMITLRSGMTIAIAEWRSGGDLKMYRAYQDYANLTDLERTNALVAIG